MQPLHGLTFALLHLACMRLIVQVVPVRLAATAQSIYGTMCIGLATALLTLASGLLYERMGGHAFLVMAALCLLALPTVHRFTSLESGGVNERSAPRAQRRTPVRDPPICWATGLILFDLAVDRSQRRAIYWMTISRAAAFAMCGVYQQSATIRPFSGRTSVHSPRLRHNTQFG